MENQSNPINETASPASTSRMDCKIRIIRFILLSATLFFLTDSMARWFLPDHATVPGFFLIFIWLVCFATGAIQFYGWRRLKIIWLKYALIPVFIAVFCVLLSVCGIYSYQDSHLIGYKISVSIMPAWGFLIEAGLTPFIKWYGKSIKRIFHLETIHSSLFGIAMIIPVTLAILILVGSYKMSGILSQKGSDLEQFIEEGEVNHNSDHREPVRQYDRLFNDLNDTQLTAARKYGLKTPITTADAPNDRRLVHIESNRYYDLEKLTHSVPYLVPRAAELLEDMGRAFQDSLFNRGYNRNHRFTVTSVLRTEETIKQLRKTNVNSTENSCHCYGTTFDISYFTYSTPLVGRTASVDKMRQILYQVAYDMQQQGRCYVKYEKQQTCLHITTR